MLSSPVRSNLNNTSTGCPKKGSQNKRKNKAKRRELKIFNFCPKILGDLSKPLSLKKREGCIHPTTITSRNGKKLNRQFNKNYPALLTFLPITTLVQSSVITFSKTLLNMLFTPTAPNCLNCSSSSISRSFAVVSKNKIPYSSANCSPSSLDTCRCWVRSVLLATRMRR